MFALIFVHFALGLNLILNFQIVILLVFRAFYDLFRLELVKDVFNVTEYQSTKVLDKINAYAIQSARKRQKSLELCYWLIYKHIFDQ